MQKATTTRRATRTSFAMREFGMCRTGARSRGLGFARDAPEAGERSRRVGRPRAASRRLGRSRPHSPYNVSAPARVSLRPAEQPKIIAETPPVENWDFCTRCAAVRNAIGNVHFEPGQA
jgi:hypothetical protein